jgi:transcriptional regulator with GAF, ATPase, and Fis domain
VSREPLQLRVELPNRESFRQAIDRGRTVIGRSSTAGLTLDAEGISREHAAIAVEDDGIFLEDLGSTNGTRLNGERITAAHRLRAGDVIGIGRAQLTVQLRTPDALPRPSVTPPVDGASIALTHRAGPDELARLASDDRAAALLYQLAHALALGADVAALGRRLVEITERSLDPGRIVLEAGTLKLGAELTVPADARLSDGKPILVNVDAAGRGRPEDVVSAMCVPLGTGFLYVDVPLGKRRFSARDLDLLTLLANHGTALLENARLVAELSAARDALAAENVVLRAEVQGRFRFDAILGESAKIEEVRRTIELVARTDSTVLVTGESGTGKELVAKTIHHNSPRRSAPFVAVNCAAIPESLIEAELFGIEKGVATGVDKRDGKFELAGSGTIFLDEVGDLPLSLQAKLLRVLQEREIERVGGKGPRPMKARVLAATNRNLAADVAAQKFRQDLFYRLNVVPLRLPPLRERVGDVPVLARKVLDRLGAKLAFAPETLEVMKTHDWPGNVRELENEVERIVAIWDPARPGATITPAHLSDTVRQGAAVATTDSGRFETELEIGDIKDVVNRLVERAERQLILRALGKTDGNRTAAAEVLGLTREGLRKKMIRYSID